MSYLPDPYHYEYRPGGHNWKCKKPIEDKVSFTVKYYEDTDDHRTETKNETLASSLLIHIKESNPAKKDLEEAFCWDVDPFNIAFEVFQFNKVLSIVYVPPD